ncbi:RNA polymerase sigma factor sigF [Citrus sinensis]|uniref:RNA polymerase sigma factor sigF, chloroplastic isoform X2 n=1 Tax=Citrus sinensis TaxID=2711 RepID=UPI0003D6DCC5|nr:RNA polymerase sigma factor sigF, chloroplastic isoform X2 [Citrus sinensis]KAH9671461.1 RNA polymerase sigma factor sigF [Citrus sinensis]
MEAGRNLLSSPPSFPSRTRVKHSLSSSASSSSSSSVLMHNEQSAPAVASVPTSSVARHFPTSVLLQEQRDEYRPLLHMFKEDKTSQATSDSRNMETEAFFVEEKNSGDLDQLVQDLEHQFLHWPDLWNLSPPMKRGEDPSVSLTMQSLSNDTEESVDAEPFDAVALARKALSASKEAASLAENPKLNGAEFTDISLTSSLGYPLEEVKTVRSTQFLERRSKKRKVSKPKVTNHETYNSRKASVKKKLSEGFDRNDPLRLFLWGPETRKLLTADEEFELIAQIQDLIRLEKEKSKLQSQFGREPTLIEWAKAIGLSCRDLKSELHSGNSSREKLINANLRLVVHVAKQYQGRGIGLHDLLQEGSMGLMKSVEKFKPQAGCRFASYAYWWVRQTIRKAIFQHSRTIRLPENIYTLLSRVLEAKRLYIQEGNHSPDKEDLARRVGITVEKLERLIFITRMPLSMQQPVWADQDTTFQEITADTGVEIPDISVQKQLMRQHVRNLLTLLNPKERCIVRLRFGIEDGKPKSLSEVGNIFGLSKERVRQLESRALYRLKQSLGGKASYGYADLLI